VDDATRCRRPATLGNVRRFEGIRRIMAAEPRFLTLADVAEVLNISASQVYALVRNEELRAIKIGGRGQWRVERDQLEDYIKRMYQETSDFIAKHPFVDAEDASSD
jgi:excisionase family DNA binding protein